MIFEYNEYFNSCFLLPVVFLLFTLIVIVLGVTLQMREISLTGVSVERIIIMIITLSGAIFLSCIQFGHLINGGFAILTEKEDDSKEIITEVIRIDELTQFEFPNISKNSNDNSNMYGVRLITGAGNFVAPERGTIQTGDTVRMVVLPRSKYILSIYPLTE